MEIFKQVFPADCNVVVRHVAAGVEVMVRTPRPDPVWLKDKNTHGGRNPAEAGGWCKVSEERLHEWLLSAIKAEPGRGASHYVRLSKEQGGLGASQERKEKALRRLLDEGKLKLLSTDKPHKRRGGELYCPEDLPARA